MIHLRHGDHAAARAAFEQAIARVPRHLMARVGLALLDGDPSPAWLSAAPPAIDVAVARAALLVAEGDVAGAVKVVRDAPGGPAAGQWRMADPDRAAAARVGAPRRVGAGAGDTEGSGDVWSELLSGEGHLILVAHACL